MSESLLLDVPEKPKTEDLADRMEFMLQRLKEGPLSTVEAERVQHRGQATIRALRERGHRIDTVNQDGQRVYLWKSYDDSRIEVTPQLQDLYYLTPHWRLLSGQRRAFDGHRCCQCSAFKELNVHHWQYKLFYEDMRQDLMTLCRPCHEAVHGFLSGSQVHFPRFLHKDIVARIQQEARQ